jgi:prolyl oligopeptidase
MKATGLKLSSSLLLFVLSISALGQAVNDGFGPYPPAPKPEPLTETVHGITVSDPYRWMESPARHDEMVAWVKASSAQTTAALARLPGRAPLLKALEDASRSTTSHSSVKSAGGRIFFLELAPDRDIPVLKVRENGQDRLLLDPMANVPAGTHRTINNYSPSPNGNLIAVHMAEGGGEVGSIRIYDVATGKALEDTLTPIWGEFAAIWIDNKTFTYTRMTNPTGNEDSMQNMSVFLHRLGTPVSTDVAVLGSKVGAGFPMQPVEFPSIFTPSTSRYAVAIASNARVDARIGFTSLAALTSGKPQWKPLADYDDKINDFDLVGDTLYYLTTARDPNGEVRSVDLRQGSLSASRPVPTPKDVVLKGVTITIQGLYINAMNPDASSRLLFLPNYTGHTVEVPLPVVGALGDFSVPSDQTSMTLEVNGIQQNATHYRLDGPKLVALGISDATLPAAASMTVVQETATSADGTSVPLTIVAPKGPVKPLPALLNTYAGYGISDEPYYSTGTVVWVMRGGVMADCHARGGGEKGRAWHEAGRSANKVNSMADVIACGERLVQLGYTTPKLLGLWSGSAGGLLVTPVGLKRPDLFAAVVTSVGVVNPTRFAVANNGPNQFAENGDPNTDEGFRALAAQDSTLLLANAQGGTSQLFTIGLNDHRVDPWMSAKLVAMMRAKWGDQHLVLIRADSDAGHGWGSGRDQRLAEQADIYAFLLNRFDQPGFLLDTERAAK